MLFGPSRQPYPSRQRILQIPEHWLGLIDLVLNHFARLCGQGSNGVPDLCCRIAHGSFTILLIHRILSTKPHFPVSTAEQICRPEHSLDDRSDLKKFLKVGPAGTTAGLMQGVLELFLAHLRTPRMRP